MRRWLRLLEVLRTASLRFDLDRWFRVWRSTDLGSAADQPFSRWLLSVGGGSSGPSGRVHEQDR
jgi:hypothetical protein